MISGLPENSEAEVTVTITCILDDKLANTFVRLENDTKLRDGKSKGHRNRRHNYKCCELRKKARI